jgi:hypothetical protein
MHIVSGINTPNAKKGKNLKKIEGSERESLKKLKR